MRPYSHRSHGNPSVQYLCLLSFPSLPPSVQTSMSVTSARPSGHCQHEWLELGLRSVSASTALYTLHTKHRLSYLRLLPLKTTSRCSDSAIVYCAPRGLEEWHRSWVGSPAAEAMSVNTAQWHQALVGIRGFGINGLSFGPEVTHTVTILGDKVPAALVC